MPDTRQNPENVTPRCVLLVGGGRWGRVHAETLRGLLSHDARILWVSEHNAHALAGFVAGRAAQGPAIALYRNLDEALKQQPQAAIIVTAAYNHAATARSTLALRIPTFVEKPLALDESKARELVALADRQQVAFGVGLHMFFASYLRHFQSLWRSRPVASCELTWFDVETEIRYGEKKRTDIWTDKVHDVFPHLWTILRVLFPDAALSVRDAATAPLGATKLTLAAGQIPVTAAIGRHGPDRARRIVIRFADGGEASLDYTSEPGVITLDGKPAAPDPAWATGIRPLAAEIAAFFAAGARPDNDSRWPGRAADVIGSVTGAIAAADCAAAAAATVLAQDVRSNGSHAMSTDMQYLLTDNIAPELHELRSRLEQHDAGRSIAIAAAALLRAERGGTIAAPPDVPAELFDAVRRSDFIRRVRHAAASR